MRLCERFLSKLPEPIVLFVGAEASAGASAMRVDLRALGMAVCAVDLKRWEQSELRPAVILTGTSLGRNIEALRDLEAVVERASGTPVLFYTSASCEEVAISALRLRASEYLRLPVAPAELRASVSRLIGVGEEGRRSGRLPVLVGKSEAMRQVRGYVEQVARTDSNVLISGATGTGKELVAQLVHLNSARMGRPMVSVNCAAIPDTLLESELFGYERGAFTGAVARTEGKLRQAHTGTIFLDEIGDMSACAQAKVLRALEQKRIQRLGGTSDVEIDVRIIAATHHDLDALVQDGIFRADLFFRLSVGRVELPSLSRRKEDIPDLVEQALDEFNRRFDRRVRGITAEAMEYLMRYDWPGNVRELRNVLEACFIIVRSSQIGVPDFPPYFRNRCEGRTGCQPADEGTDRDKVIRALVSTNWNKSKAARTLRWSRMTLYRKMALYRIDSRQ
jgi:DNA-binding NtrC family response regulator